MDYTHGTVSLIPEEPNDLNLNSYSSSIGVTYLTSNTVSTKFYGGEKSSGIEVNYEFIDDYPVIPMISFTDTELHVISYAVDKDLAYTVVPNGVFVLDEFTITK